jgi:NAD(P)-dependent dehydrogenase (short-subunit alcohol dehydrogenase family)
MILEGKTVIVAGVGVGLGKEVATLALRDGANVVLAARKPERLESLAAELDASAKRVAWVATDVTKPEHGESLVAKTRERFGGVDALVHVAALDTLFGGVRDTPADDWRKAFAVNVVGATSMVRAVAPAMAERGGGSIVLIGSQSMYLPQVMQIAYAASKGALETAMRYMAKELGPDRIRVNMVIPTWMWGPPVEGWVKSQAKHSGAREEDVIAGITKTMPLGRIPADEDVAEAVVFFCSDRARMITGQSLMVNAGELMR